MRIVSLIAAAALATPVAVFAQAGVDTLSLLGRTTISAGIGLTSTSSSTASAATASTHASGEVASLSLSHWVRPTVAVEISAAVLGADATASPGHARDNVLTPILFGVSVSPRSIALSTSVRPYVSLTAGPYIHTVSDVLGATATTTVETVAGARIATGANWFVSRHFLLGVEGNYHAVAKFDHPDALTTKPSGFGMTASIGFAWGGR